MSEQVRCTPTSSIGELLSSFVHPLHGNPYSSHHIYHLASDTSQTYLLFQTLLLLFCPHSCMIWTKLTRTNAVFSRASCMVYLCAGKWIFRRSRKFPENPRTRRSQKPEVGPEGSPGGPRRPPGTARGGAAPSGRLGASPLLWF